MTAEVDELASPRDEESPLTSEPKQNDQPEIKYTQAILNRLSGYICVCLHLAMIIFKKRSSV